MTNYNERLDEILDDDANWQKDGYNGYELDMPAMKQAILRWVADEVIGEDETDDDEVTNDLYFGTRNGLRKTQRAKLKEVMGGE